MRAPNNRSKFSGNQRFKKKSTTRLPQTIVDELYSSKKKNENDTVTENASNKKRKISQTNNEDTEFVDDRKFSKKFVNRSASRKEKRKEERKVKKQKSQRPVKASKESVQKTQVAKAKIEPVKVKTEAPKIKKETPTVSKPETPVESSKSQLTHEELEEDRYLRALEKKLKIKDASKLATSKSFVEDGLDDLLSGIAVGSNKLRKDPVFESDASDSESKSDEELIEGAHYYSTRDVKANDTESESENDEEIVGSDSDSQDEDIVEPSTEAQDKPLSKYVPPHLRNSDDKLVKLRRLLQGLLNRLGESNIESTLFEIDGYYLDYSRNAVTTTLSELVLLSVKNRPVLHDSFVIVNAALVAGLYRIVGTEAAAHFTQTLVEQLLDHHKKSREDTDSGENNDTKLCVNLTTLVAELYNLGVVSCILMYSLIRFFLEDLDDLNIELLLKTIRAIGPALRHDDPSAMKDIIVMAQKAASEKSNLGARFKFMMEVLTDLKNNKIKKSSHLATQASLSDDMVRRMKTMLKNLEKHRQVMGSEPLNVSLEDILSSSHKGKWWLVGSAWKGDEQPIQAPVSSNEHGLTDSLSSNDPNSLMQLAREHSMSTDIRKRVFTVLMSAEDFSDAYERLMKLGLSEKQQRDIPRVILHCCGNEKTYNPFYGLVATRLNAYSASFKITFQYALWDFLRELGEAGIGGLGGAYNSMSSKASQVPVRRVLNSAKFYAYLLSKSALSLTILKPVSFTSLQPRSRLFIQLLLVNLLFQTDDTTLSTHIAKLKDLPELRQGLSFFLHHFVIPSNSMVALSDFNPEQVVSRGKFLAELLMVSD